MTDGSAAARLPTEPDPERTGPEGMRIDPGALLDLKIAGYVGNLPGVILGNIAAAILIAYVFWPFVPIVVLVPWVGAIFALMAVQTHRLFLYRRHPERFGSSRRLSRLLILGAFLTGSLWGSIPWLFAVPERFELQVFALFTLAVLNTGGAATLAPYYPAYVASLLPCLPAGALKAFDLTGEFGPAAGIGLLILSVFLAGLGRVMSKAFDGSYRIQLTQGALIARMRAQTEVARRAAEEARLANKAKSEFLATISHEIRTPVNAILGGLDILASTPLEPRQTQCVQIVDKAGHSLLSLLDDLLDMSRIEAGRLSLNRVTFALHERINDVIELMAPKAAEKGLSLDLGLAPEVPTHVDGDPARLRQILLNLIGNAIKFTDRGGVSLAVEVVASEPATPADAIAVRFTVTDTGIGIAEDRIDSIFQAFTQADGSISRRFGGTGLGLSISRRLAEIMGGDLSVESRLGEGSRFHLQVPLTVAAAPAAREPPLAVPTWSRRPVLLLVEDEAVNRFVAVQVLTRHGFDVVEASGGGEALHLIQTRPIDVVLMDLSMPDLDGFATAERIRALPPPRGSLPIVALTAHVLTETVERCRASGMQGFVSKPIRVPVLLRALAECLPPESLALDPVAAPSEPIRLVALRRELGDAALEDLISKARATIEDGRLALARPRLSRRQAGDIAHRLAGTLDILGAQAAVDAMRELESAALAKGRGVTSVGRAKALAALDAVLTELPKPTAPEILAAVVPETLTGTAA